ncbi:MAG: lamin tail domain-containing protein [Limisphaerales bacterium]
MALALAASVLSLSADEHVLITELMYHPSSEDSREEFVELHNPGSQPVNLAGWRFTAGVRFTFPSVTIAPGGYLAVAADPATFTTLHPTVTQVVGGWEGILSNSGQSIELVDAQGVRVDAVRYADEGDWAERRLAAPDSGHRGWVWTSRADGGGRSLELVSLTLPNKHGQNWSPSAVVNGTPGQPNSVARADVAPFILDVSHFPIVPRSTEAVRVTARVVDESRFGLVVTAHHRIDGAPDFLATPMVDDGLHGDGAADDGVFGAELPAQTNATIVEFYVEARDPGALSRTFPAPADMDGIPSQEANLLYQVDDLAADGPMPACRLILRAVDLAELRQINANDPRPAPYPTSDQTRSHAQVNATLISADGHGIELRYLVGVRNRGNGSRTHLPQSYRVNFRNDDAWKGVSAINLNSQYSHAQLFGSVLYRGAGLPTQSSRPVRVILNNDAPATSGPPSYGFHVLNEVLNSDFADHVFPADSSGNMYRGLRLSGAGADLHFEGTDPAPYRDNYQKESNVSEDDWSDLIELTRVLELEPDPTYADAVRRVVNVEEWMLYFALETLVDNRETNLGNGNNGTGQGDDYFLYRGTVDRRFAVLPYDLDTILDQGDTRGKVEDGLFRMNANPVIARLMTHPEFAPIYYATLTRLIETTFASATFDSLVDRTLSGLVPNPQIEGMKTFAAARRDFVLSQIPRRITVSNELAVVNGYAQATQNPVALRGAANAVRTRAVHVNGQTAGWSAWTGTWSIETVALLPGVNRVLVQAFDGLGQEFERSWVDLWLDHRAPTPKSGLLAADETWSAANGPYLVATGFSVGAGATLTLEPGTTVYVEPGADFRVAAGGTLNAIGTDVARIVFTRQPGTGAWDGLSISGAASLAYVHFEGNGSTALHATDATVVLDHLTFGNAAEPYLSLDRSSFVVSHCHFPKPLGGFEPLHGSGGIKAGGVGILRDCFVGAPMGYNDAFDFTGGKRPGPILQIVNNVFQGSGDDLLDLDGTDAWIEGNVFLHTHKNGSPDSASAVSGGSDSGRVSYVTVINNLFYDCDQAATAKQGNFYTLLNNTIVRTTRAGGTDDESAVVNFADDGTSAGAGCHLAGNVVIEAEGLVRNYDPANTTVTFTNNWLPQPWKGPGGGNVIGTPRVRHLPSMAETDFQDFDSAQVMWDWLSLAPGSPELGFKPVTPWISGAPVGTTRSTEARLTVGPWIDEGLPWVSGFTHYRWRLDDGDWSAETAASEPIALADLGPGRHRIEVAGRNDAGTWQDGGAVSWDVDPTRSRLVLNEVLAANRSVAFAGSFPDLIELFNDSATPVDLGGVGLTTNPAYPFAFVFPAGTTIPADEFLVVAADNEAVGAALHAGFALKQGGDALYLFETAARGGQLLDSIQFGPQLADRSIGRLADDSWNLTQPTFGAVNRPQALGEPAELRINEWLAAPDAVFREDFVELYNRDPLPVALDGLWLSDHPICPQPPLAGDPSIAIAPPAPPPGTRLPTLGFVDGHGFLELIADGEPGRGATHLTFKLEAEQGSLSLSQVRLPSPLEAGLSAGTSAPTLVRLVDCIEYSSQQPGVAEGRSPNGSDTLAFLRQPTPGASNPGSSGTTNITTVTVPLLALNESWRYWQDGAPDSGWHAAEFAEASWPIGMAPLGHEPDPLPVPLATDLALGKTTYYFRAHFDFPTNAAGWRLQLQTYIDDGAVFWLNGQILHRQNLAAAVPSYATFADSTVDEARIEGPFELPAPALREGDNVLAVEVHQRNSGSGDIVFAARLDAIRHFTNLAGDAALAVLNEVLASNRSITNAAGLTPDWVELHNPSAQAVDLTGCSLSNDPADPRRFVFPTNSIVPPLGFLVLECQGNLAASATNTGFNLDASGATLRLFEAPARGGGLIDAISFGRQIPDYPIGREDAGTDEWHLNLPTPGAANQRATLGQPLALRVNEWMASPAAGNDWFELFNSSDWPVDLGGLFLTDDLNRRDQHRIAPRSFIGTGADAFATFQADGNDAAGGQHVSFKLAAGGESIGVFDAAGRLIDGVTFGSQQVGASEGRFPDGSGPITRFPETATPGSANQVQTGLVDTDRDGLPDDWERAYFLDELNPDDAGEDVDRDGLTNLEEFLAGTSPRDPGSRLGFDGVDGFIDGVVLRFKVIAGRDYTVEYRDAVEDADWLKLEDVAPLRCDCEVTVSDRAPSPSGRRFYRIVTPVR